MAVIRVLLITCLNAAWTELLTRTGVLRNKNAFKSRILELASKKQVIAVTGFARKVKSSIVTLIASRKRIAATTFAKARTKTSILAVLIAARAEAAVAVVAVAERLRQCLAMVFASTRETIIIAAWIV